MVRFGFAAALAGVALAVLGSAPYLLMGILLQDGDVPDVFDVLMGVSWGLGGTLVVGGLFTAALGTVLGHQRPRTAAPKP
jgi:hypothetical protein